MVKRMIIMLVCVAVLLGAIVGFNMFKTVMIKKFMAGNAAPPATVTTTNAHFSDWQPQVTAVGSLRALRGVDVTTEIAGMVRSLHFHSGDEIKQGALLVQLNADSDIAQLQAYKATAELAASTLARDKEQFAIEAISKAQLDNDEASLKSARAQVAQQEAVVAKKTIRAPFSGRVGISTVNPGQYLNPGDKVVTLQTIDPIYIDFTVPQQQLSGIAVGQSASVTTDAYAGATFTGKVTAIDPKVDPATRNVQVEATLSNEKRQLLPGMYGSVAINVGSVQHYLTLPQTAVTYNPYGATVFIAKPGETKDAQGKETLVAQQVFVTTGPTRGDQVAILKGIEDGQTVVTSGQLKLKNGTRLIVDNHITPADDAHPTPQEH